MRVSNVIKGYIEEKVGEAFAEKSQAEIEYAELIKQIREFQDRLDDTVTELINNMIAEFRIEFNIPDDISFRKTDYSLIRYEDWNSAIRTEAVAIEHKRASAKQRAIKDIIVTLELGGTKADLDKMLANLNTNYMN